MRVSIADALRCLSVHTARTDAFVPHIGICVHVHIQYVLYQ